MSQTYANEGKKSFVTKLKVVDPSFNLTTVIESDKLKFQRYAIIHIYSETTDEAPKVQNVGDLIRLRRFTFQINSMGELVGYDTSFSNWLIYEGSACEDFKAKSYKQIAANGENRQPHAYEKERLRELRQWSSTFFGDHSLKIILWWSKIIQPNTEDPSFKHEQKSIDLILQVNEVNLNDKSILFADENGIEYKLFLNSTPVITKNNVLKLRNCHVFFEGTDRTIVLSNNSSCLVVPAGFYDYKMFNEDFRAENKDKPLPSPLLRNMGEKERYLTRRSITNKLPTLKDYYIEDYLIDKKKLIENPPTDRIASKKASLLKKEYVNRVPIKLSDLINMTPEEVTQNVFQKFVINVRIQDISELSDKCLFQYFRKSNKVFPIANAINSKSDEKPVFVTCLKMMVEDSSIDLKKWNMPIYITTKDENSDPFVLWKIMPSCLNYKDWSHNIKDELLMKFGSKLDALRNFQREVELVIELKRTSKGQPFFNVTDTLFLP